MGQSMAATVLVVNHDPADRALWKTLLEARGYRVVTARNGRGALKEFARLRPDLVLLGVLLPGLDRFEVCRRLNKTNAAARLTPVVLVDSHTATGDPVCGLQAGADAVLSKGVCGSRLCAHVDLVLNLKAFVDRQAGSVLLSLARSIEEKDPYTEGHCERLADYAVRLGQRLGLSGESIHALRIGGVVHDVGKVTVPNDILLKPGRLARAEMKILREHPVVGERICAPLRSFRHVLPIIRHHHERMDGRGYPDGLRNGRIPLTARILQTVDIYDALTTNRPYRKAFSSEKALAVMHKEAKRGWRDDALIKEFENLLAR